VSRQDTGAYSRVAASLGGVGLLTFLFVSVIPANTTTIALAYMLLVLCISAVWSRVEALTVAFAAGLALDYYFLPPMGFRIAAPSDIVALIFFVVCALIASHLSLTARERAAEANLRQDEMARLYALGRALMLSIDESEPGGGVTSQIMQLFGFPGVALYERAGNRIYRDGNTAVPIADDLLRSGVVNTPPAGCVVLALAHEGMSLGTLAILDKGTSPITLHAISNLAAAALFRAQRLRTARTQPSPQAT